MKYNIEIDLGPLADEWEPVAFEPPGSGDAYINAVGEIEIATHKHAYPRLIVRRRWHWPEWLMAEWIAMDMNGLWYGYDGEPVTDCDEWEIHGGIGVEIDRRMIAFTPPSCTDWRQSKRRNPRAK